MDRKTKNQLDIDITASSDSGKRNGLNLISRQDAIDYCYQLINVEHQQGSDDMNYGAERVNQTETILHHLEFMASAEPERKTGKWIDDEFLGQYRCSECDYYSIDEYNFCPNCGADMREGGER